MGRNPQRCILHFVHGTSSLLGSTPCPEFGSLEPIWNLSVSKCWQPNPGAAAGSGELTDPLLLHFYSSDPPVQTPAVLQWQGTGNLQPFLPHSPLFDHFYNQSLQFIGQHKEGSCPKSSGGNQIKPLGGASSPSLLPLRLLWVISLQKCGVATALQDCTTSLVMLYSWRSRNGKKLSFVGRAGAWTPSIWPLKTFAQHLLLSQQSENEAAESSGQQRPGGQHCPARFLGSLKADSCLYLLGCSRILHGINPTFTPDLPSSWKWLKQGCDFSLRAFTFHFFGLVAISG